MVLRGSELLKWVMIVLCGVILYGCASYPNETRQIIDSDIVSSIKPGKTTKAEVESILGKPYTVSTYEVLSGPEEEEWAYFTIAEVIPGSLMSLLTLGPPVGVAAGLTAKYATSSGDKFYNLSIRFSKQGIVKQVEKCKITGRASEQRQRCEGY